MTLVKILSKDEIKAFENPPEFTLEARRKFFYQSKKVKAKLNELKSPTSQVGFFLQYGYFKATGKFYSVPDYHIDDIKYLCSKLRINFNEIDLSFYHNNKTAYRHQVLSSILLATIALLKTKGNCWINIYLVF